MTHFCSASTARVCIGVSVLLFGLCLGMAGAQAQDENQTWEGPGTDWSVDSNWSNDTEPTGIATFTNNGAPTSVTNSGVVLIEEINFTALAPAYIFTNPSQFIIAGAGIVNNSVNVQTFVNNLLMHLFDGTAGDAAITNNSTLEFDNSSAGSATITNNSGGNVQFNNASTAGSATITNNDLLTFDDSNAGSATIINNDGGRIDFDGSSTAGGATITNNDGGTIGFFNTSSAGSATITNNNGGEIDFRGSSNAGSATITNDDSLEFRDTSNAGSATITNDEILQFFGTSTAGSATITNDLLLRFSNASNAGSATITNNEIIEFLGTSTAGSATITNNEDVVFLNNSTGGQARFTNLFGAIDFSGSSGPTGTGQLSAGSLAGAGSYFLGANQLTVGGNNLSSEVSGVISDCGPTGSQCVNTGATGGSLIKVGTSTFTLSGNNIYTGPTTVAGGTLVVNGSIVSPTTVDDGGTLKGTGQLGAVTVEDGGIYAPGNSIGTQFVNGAFTLKSNAIFEVEVNAAGQSDKVVVVGSVNLSGAVLRVLAESGNYKPKTDYLIIDNDGTDAVAGTFSKVTTNFAFLTPQVNYQAGKDNNDVVLTLLRTVVPPNGNGGNGGFVSFCSVAVTPNQCNVAHALDRFPEDDPLFLAVLTQTVDGARQAFDALSGEIHATLPAVLADDSRYVREAVLGRLTQASYTGPLAALGAGGPQGASQPMLLAPDAEAMRLGSDKSLAPPPADPDLAFWTRGYGAWGDFDGNRNAASAERDLGGFVSGADAQVSDTWRIGLAAGGAWSNVSVGARQSSAQLESFHLAGYAGGMAGPLALRAGGAYAWQDVETSRAVVFPGFFERQETSYDADTGQLFGEIAYPIASGGIALEPFAGLAYVNVDTERFREHGGALSALNGSSSDQDIGYSTLGLRAGTALHWGGTLVVPKVSAAWQHAFDDVTPDAALAFASTGIGFGVTGVPLAEDSLLIEAGLDFALSPTATLGVSYSGQVASEAQDNAVKGRLTWLF